MSDEELFDQKKNEALVDSMRLAEETVDMLYDDINDDVGLTRVSLRGRSQTA